MSEDRFKLHPVAAVVDFVKGLKELILPFLIIFFANGFNVTFNPGDGSFWASIVPLGIFVLVIIVRLINGVLKWWTYVYWFEEKELRVEYGLLVKKKRYIPFDRIQSLNYKEGIFHRIFGLVQVMVETAGSTNGKPEVILTAITKEAADQIELVTRKSKEEEYENELQSETGNSVEKAQAPSSRVIHKMNKKDLLVLATTSSSMGVVIAGVAAALSQFAEFIPFEWLFEEFSDFIKFGFVIVAFAVFVSFLFTWVIAVIITFINYYDFTVIEENERLTITRGLLEKKRVTIPLNRIQAIKIVENPVRQMFGFAAVAVESASGGFGGEEKKITLFPLIKKSRLFKPLHELLPELEWQQALTKPPKKAKPFFYRIDFVWLLPVIALCSYIWFPYGLFSLLIIVPIILLGLWQFKTTGYAISGNQLTLCYRIFSRVTFVVEKKRIQALESRQTFFQKRREIASVEVTVMSGFTGATAKALNLETRDIEEMMSWLEKNDHLK
ncbi:PH domain-containing protein [Ureibacillus chungkukjangi]|uniref:Putative membrane protein n=1 Tax=Ureibacillus chungkukjangi TaxID=1202712 RepID=A0A318TBZ4_9BACL|nr:PH domain-containing protein [Ureibacillus chungkukjangi]MCM3389734.1 PH domain-containing protein [Ureibacillus chungkukjangi]PYF02214.1 putative membrane protein [Ureibacillus chungkukjangi]